MNQAEIDALRNERNNLADELERTKAQLEKAITDRLSALAARNIARADHAEAAKALTEARLELEADRLWIEALQEDKARAVAAQLEQLNTRAVRPLAVVLEHAVSMYVSRSHVVVREDGRQERVDGSPPMHAIQQARLVVIGEVRKSSTLPLLREG